jgi:hypothetical protein
MLALTLGVEPSPPALQAGAITVFARSGKLLCWDFPVPEIDGLGFSN